MRILKSFNPTASKLKALVIVPHDSTNELFFEEFPELLSEAKSRDCLKAFMDFIHIESDKGALEIADSDQYQK